VAFSLEETIDFALTQRLAAVWTTLLARVLSYDDASQTANLQPFPAVYQDDEPTAIASLSSVRVCFGGRAKWKLSAGDVGTVHFCARSIAVYQQNGSEGDPGEVRMHDLSDALFDPTNSGGATLPTETGDNLRIYEPTGAKVSLGTAGLGRKAVARNADPVPAGGLNITAVPTVPPALPGVIITFTYTDANGVTTAQILTLLGILTGAVTGVPAVLAGKITATSAKVEAG